MAAAALTNVREVQGWITIDGPDVQSVGRHRVFRLVDGRVERAVLLVRDKGQRGAIVKDKAGVLLTEFGERAASGLDAVVGAELFMRAAGLHPVARVVVTWDGTLDLWAPLQPGPRTHEVDEAHALLVTCLPAIVQARIDPDVATDRGVLHDALTLDTFDALIPTSSVVHAVSAIRRSRPVENAEIAGIVRALFPEQWTAESELREQLATLDDAGVRWLLSRRQG